MKKDLKAAVAWVNSIMIDDIWLISLSYKGKPGSKGRRGAPNYDLPSAILQLALLFAT